jgi:cobyrinic acid a,c-diamide synthase
VRVFKTGPDYIDPMILEQASGNPVYPLDLWMVGEDECRRRLSEAASEADIILIEGVMGLYDGTPSSADLALCFGVPVLLAVDASAMAQTFAAIVHGLTSYRDGLCFAGVVANRVGSPGHAQLLRRCVGARPPYLGGLLRDSAMEIPSRHLGLLQAPEVEDLEQRLATAAAALAKTEAVTLTESVAFSATPGPAPPRLLSGRRIGVAKDEAFSFIYPSNLELLSALGAELSFFSPLRDPELPSVDSLYLPGGYPELHLQTLSQNRDMKAAIARFARQGGGVYAECGGMLYLFDTLRDKQGCEAAMVGLLSGAALMQARLCGLGMQSLTLPKGELRGHTFHHSRLQTSLRPWIRGRRQDGSAEGEFVYRTGSVIASYLHLYFPGNPEAAASLFG